MCDCVKIIMDDEYDRIHKRLTDGERFIYEPVGDSEDFFFTYFRDGKMMRVINQKNIPIVPVKEYIIWRRSHVCVCVWPKK